MPEIMTALKLKIIIIIICTMSAAGYVLAQEAVKKEEYEKIISECERLYRNDPKNELLRRRLCVAYHNRGIEAAAKGVWKEALESEEKAYDLAPEEENVKNALSVYYNNYGLQLKEKGNLEESLKCLESALNHTPDNSRIKKNMSVIYVELAQIAYKKGYYDRCRNLLREAGRFDKENPGIYVLSGDLAYSSDNYYQAGEDWSKALEFQPDNPEIKARLAKLSKESKIENNFKVREVFNFKLKFEGIEKQDLADAVAKVLKECYRDVGSELDFYPDSIIPVIIYPQNTLKEMDDYFPTWASGAYDGKIRMGENVGKSELLMRLVLFHEYTHALIYLLAANNAPLWLQEGLADYESKKYRKVRMNIAREKLLYRQAKNNEIYSLDELAGMDLNKMGSLSQEKRELIYVQSESFVAYLIKRYSIYDIRKVIAALGKGSDIRKAVKDVLYEKLEVLESDWKEDLFLKARNYSPPKEN